MTFEYFSNFCVTSILTASSFVLFKGDGKCMACADGLLGIVALVFFGMGFATLVGYYMMPSVYRAKAPRLPMKIMGFLPCLLGRTG